MTAMIEQIQLLLDAARWRASEAEEDFDNAAYWPRFNDASALVETLEAALHAAKKYQQTKEQTE